MPTVVLGVNCAYHESSACLLKDGAIVAAVEEERFNRVKHAKQSRVDNADELPLEALAYVLRAAGVQPSQVEHVGLTLDPERRLAANRDLGEPGIPPGDFGTPEGEETFARHVRAAGALLRAQFPRAEIHFLSHHLCHAASAFFPSRHERAAVLTVDGIGEFSSTWMGLGKGNQLETIAEVGYPNSLGFLWEKLSEHLGFDPSGGPGKMMGYGSITDPVGESSQVDYAQRLRQVVQLTDTGFTVDNRVTRFRTRDFSGLEHHRHAEGAAGHRVEADAVAEGDALGGRTVAAARTCARPVRPVALGLAPTSSRSRACARRATLRARAATSSSPPALTPSGIWWAASSAPPPACCSSTSSAAPRNPPRF